MKIRKIFALFLSLCLIFGAVPITALAADQTNAGAGIRIQYLDGSYDKTTGIMKVCVQAKMPAGTGISSVGTLLSYDNTKLTVVNKNNTSKDVTSDEGVKKESEAIISKTLIQTVDDDESTKEYTLQDSAMYKAGDRSGIYTFHYNGKPSTQKATDAQTGGEWFNVYEVMFRVAGKPDDPATVLNRDSLRIADVAKGDDAVMKGAFPANNIYSIYLTDNSNPAKLYVLNRMSGCTETEVTGEKSLMTAPGTGTATYPGSTNEPPKPAAELAIAPTGETGLTYNGTDQALLNAAGTATNGTMQYSLDNATWVDNIPKATNAGDYKVYYKVKGDATHSDFVPSSNAVDVKIAAKDISSATIDTIAAKTYNKSPFKPEPVVKDGATELVKDKDFTYSYKNNTNAGTAEVTVTGKGNYQGSKTANFAINKATQTITVPSSVPEVNMASSLDLSSLCSSNATDATLVYALQSSASSPGGPTIIGSTFKAGTTTGEYTVTVNSAATSNYEAAPEKTFKVKVVALPQASITTAPTAKTGLTYNGNAQPLVEAGIASGGTMQYSLNNATWIDTIPEAKAAGDYTVYFKVKGDANHNNYTPTSNTVNVTIAKKDVTIIGLKAENKVYNGDITATVKGTATVEGKEGSDAVDVTAGTASFDNKNVGVRKTVKFTGYGLSGTDAGNYNLKAQPADVTADITVKEVIVTGITATNRGYAEGNVDVDLTGGTVSGAVSGDTITVDLSNAKGKISDANASNNKAVTVSGVKLGGADKANYVLKEQPKGITVDIAKAAHGNETATGTAKYGAEGTVDLSGLIVAGGTAAYVSNSDTSNVMATVPAIDGKSLKFKFKDVAANIGKTATVNVKVQSANYADYDITVTLTVGDKEVPTVTAQDITVTYTGSPVPDSAIKGTAKVGETVIPGTWAFKTGEAVTNVADSGSKTVVFTPNDTANYASKEATINVTIKKATPIGEPAYTKIAEENKTLTDVAIAVGTITPTGGTFKWIADDGTTELAGTTVVEKNKGYNWIYTPTDANYDVLKGKVTPYYVAPSSGGGGYIPSTTPTAKPSTEPVQAGKVTTSDLAADTTSKGNETSTTVNQAAADKIVDAAIKNRSEEIVISTKVKNETAASGVKAAKLTLPTTALQTIAEKTDAKLTLQTDVGQITLDNKTIAAVAAQSGSGTVSMSISKVKDAAKEVRFELQITGADGKQVSDFNGGKATIVVAVPQALSGKKIGCVYIDANAHYHKVPGKLNTDGSYTFTTEHFSSYAIMEAAAIEESIAAQKAAVKELKLKLTSKLVKSKKGKKQISLRWKNTSTMQLDGVQIYRSTKKNSGYSKKVMLTSKSSRYTDTAVKQGKKYYYKARGYVTIDGERVYTAASTKAYRTVK